MCWRTRFNTRTQRLVGAGGKATETLQDSYFNPQIKIGASVLDSRSDGAFFLPADLTDRGF